METMELATEFELAMHSLPRPPRLPGWRQLLADRRAEVASKPFFDALAARDAAGVAAHAAATVRPSARRSRREELNAIRPTNYSPIVEIK